MKRFLFVFFYVYCFLCYCQNDTIWLNSAWEKVDKSLSQYYSLKTKKNKGNYIFSYYDKTNILQITAETKYENSNFWDSEFISYTKFDTIEETSYKLTGIKKSNGTEDWKLFKDGFLIIESSFLNSYPIGKWKQFYENSNVIKKEINYKDYYECFNIVEETIGINLYNLPQRFTNIYSHFFESSGDIIDGCLDGSYIEYNKDGSFKVEGNFKDGYPSGVWKYNGKSTILTYDFSNFSFEELSKIEITLNTYRIGEFQNGGQLKSPNKHFEIVANIRKDKDTYTLSYLSIDMVLLAYFENSKLNISEIVTLLYKKISKNNIVDISYEDFEKQVKGKFELYYYYRSL